MQSSICTQTPGRAGGELRYQRSHQDAGAHCPGCGTPSRGRGSARREGLVTVGESGVEPQDQLGVAFGSAVPALPRGPPSPEPVTV